MLGSRGFDLWADGYDKDVQLSDEKDDYPFAGYKEVLNTIYKLVHKIERARILDIGFGTALLTKKLYDDGYEIYGMDFSPKMVDIARAKMPGARLVEADISQGLPEELKGLSFDYVISSYVLHHLDNEERIRILKVLKGSLKKEGSIIVGDIAFRTRAELEASRENYQDIWDEEEVYFVEEELRKDLAPDGFSFIKVSRCAGIFVISQK